MWSGPRNLSTAMMRSFEARGDCAVLDEPFFAPYLAVTGIDHPGRAETLAQCETSAANVAKSCAAPETNGQPYSFQKHMPHHMLLGSKLEMPLAWSTGARHFFLLRHPARVIASYAKGRPDFHADDLGFAAQLSLYERFARKGLNPILIHSEDILAAPARALAALCEGLGIEYTAKMLRWEKGPRATDGPWAPWWYGAVEKSTGFSSPPGKLPEIGANLQPIYRTCMDSYRALSKRAMQL